MKKIMTSIITTSLLTVFSSAAYCDDTTTVTHPKKHHKHARASSPTASSATEKNNTVTVAYPKKHHHRLTRASSPAPTPAPNADNSTTALGTAFLKHVTGTFDLTTNYMFRGISNSNNLPAVQGGLTYTTDLGLYFNIWGSNVDFPDVYGNTATVEWDTIVGFTNKVGDNFTYNIYLDRYNYPKTAASYIELMGSITYKILTAFIGYSGNVFASHQSGTYVNLGFNIPIPAQYVYFNNVNFTGGIGHYNLPASIGSYSDFNLGLAKTLDKYTFAVEWTDTNGGQGPAVQPLANSKIIGTISATF